jgi:choline dehydrogenase
MTMITGKLLGGTSRINNGLYSRCQPAEFIQWGEGWDFDQLEKLYDRSESNISNSEKTNPTGEWKTRLVEAFFQSSQM